MIHDVIIVGAGPCGLAVAARLCESTPSALFTDSEHARFWRRFSHNQTIEKENKRAREGVSNGTKSDASNDGVKSSINHSDILVLDASSNKWLSSWHSRFEALRIDQLRSPLFFHCDPRDRDGLLEFAYVKGRSGELEEIQNVVGREVSKHQKKKRTKRTSCQCNGTVRHLNLDNRDTIDYFTPSSSLFQDYCDTLSLRYNIGHLVQKAEVSMIEYGDAGIPTETRSIFSLTTTSGQVHFARVIVLATGPGTQPDIPAEYRSLLSHPNSSHSLSHIFDPSHSTVTSHLPAHIRSTLLHKPAMPLNIAIIGGGLTSAQLTHLLLSTFSKSHNLKIHLILRSGLKVKHFDVDLPWVTKFRNRNMAEFWSADSDQERFEMLKQARNGGSMPPRWEKLLRNYEKAGKVKVHSWTKILPETAKWDNSNKTWNLEVESNPPARHSRARSENLAVESTNEPGHKTTSLLPPISHVFFATGLPPSIEAVSCLSSLRNNYPISSINGLPQINEDLMWNDEVPLFVTGALAGLRLGPGAGNLAGARLGAERVAWGVQSILSGQADLTSRQKKRAATSGRRKNREFGLVTKITTSTSEDGDAETGAENNKITSRKESSASQCSDTTSTSQSNSMSRSASLSSASSTSLPIDRSPSRTKLSDTRKSKVKKDTLPIKVYRHTSSEYTFSSEPDFEARSLSNLSSDEGSEHEVKLGDNGDQRREQRQKQRQAFIDRSEFTGGFHNQFDALQGLSF